MERGKRDGGEVDEREQPRTHSSGLGILSLSRLSLKTLASDLVCVHLARTAVSLLTART